MSQEAPILFSVKNPVEITQASREVIAKGRRVTKVIAEPDVFNPGAINVALITAPAHEKHGLGGMEIPNQTRPHKIFESLQPDEGPIDGVNRV